MKLKKPFLSRMSYFQYPQNQDEKQLAANPLIKHRNLQSSKRLWPISSKYLEFIYLLINKHSAISYCICYDKTHSAPFPRITWAFLNKFMDTIIFFSLISLEKEIFDTSAKAFAAVNVREMKNSWTARKTPWLKREADFIETHSRKNGLHF